MFTKISNLIRKVDILGYKYNLTYKSQNTFKTCLGGCFTILITVILFLGFGFFGRELVERKQPIIVTSEKSVEKSPVSLKRLGLHFSLNDTSGRFFHYDQDFMKGIKIQVLMINFNVVDGKPSTSFDVLFMEPCQRDFFEEEAYESISKLYDVTKLLCINPNKAFTNGKLVQEEQFFYNNWSQVGTRSLWINVKLCDEKLNPGCRSWINANKSFYFLANYADSYYDASEFNNPVKFRTRTINNLVGIGLSSMQYFSLINKEAILDSGVIFQDIKNVEFTSHFERETAFQVFDENKLSIFDLFFTSPRTKFEITRRYVKLQELVADIGGFMKAVMLFFNFIGNLVGEYSFYQDFTTHFKYTQKKTVPLKRRSQISFVRTNNATKNAENSEVVRRPEESQSVSNVPELQDIEAKIHHVSFFTYLISIFSTNFGLSRGLNKVETFKYFDIEFFMMKFNEIEMKLKSMEETS